MRLLYLYVSHFRNLKEFEIEFDKEYPYSVIVGHNGTGKSNLLELLVCIFSSLERGGSKEELDFSYKIRYSLYNQNEIYVAYDHKNKKQKKKIYLNKKNISNSFFEESNNVQSFRLMPAFIFGYYSGNSKRFAEYFHPHQRKFDQELRSMKTNPFRPFFYAELVYSQFVLLAFFANKNEQMLSFLKEKLSIQRLCKIEFLLKQPEWSKNLKEPGRYWGAVGYVRVLLDELHNWIDISEKRVVTEQNDFRNKQTFNCDVLEFTNESSFQSFVDDIKVRHDDLFKVLESLYMADILCQVNITVELTNGETVKFSQLSEGEQQLLIVLGLLWFTREENSLFLLDEPDTHLNPAWSINYEEFIKMCIKNEDNSHIILTTHDPLMITSLKREQVNVLEYDEIKKKIVSVKPRFNPQTMGASGILTSELFNLRTTLGIPIQKLLDRRRDLASKESKLSHEERDELTVINKQLEEVDAFDSPHNTIYQKFIREWRNQEKTEWSNLPTLTDLQIQEQNKLVKKIIANLREKQ